MEAVITSIIQDNIISGAFLLLLWHFINLNGKNMSDFAEQLSKSNNSLDNISKTLGSFDTRLQRLEDNQKGKNPNA